MTTPKAKEGMPIIELKLGMGAYPNTNQHMRESSWGSSINKGISANSPMSHQPSGVVTPNKAISFNKAMSSCPYTSTANSINNSMIRMTKPEKQLK